MAYGVVNADKMTTSDGVSSSGLYGFKNRILNGQMVIDQRNAGASVTPTNGAYTVDRWKYAATQASKFTAQQNAGSITPPAGFTNYLGLTSSSSYSVGASDIFAISQVIEGYNVADLGFGSTNAKTITISFYVRSSLTGTFGGSLRDNAGTFTYPFTYSISSANTWEQKSIIIAGPTSGGSWNTTNGGGLELDIGLGGGSTYSGTAGAWQSGPYFTATGTVSVVGTSGATFYITGVQLEKGSTATSFDYRPYGTELQLCQRYYEKSFPIGTVPADNISTGSANTTQFITTSYSGSNYVSQNINFQTSKRAAPTMVFYTNSALGGAGTAGQWKSYIGAWVNHSSTTANQTTNTGFMTAGSFSSGGTTGQAYFATGEWTATSEL